MDKSKEFLLLVLCNCESISESGCSNKSNFTNANLGLQKMKSKCPDKLINAVQNKFDALSLIVRNNEDILMISEIKLDDSFPTAQFLLHGYRLDRNLNGGRILLYVRKDIPSRLLNSKSKTDIETVFVEITLRERKWFLNCSYNPNKNLISNRLEYLNRIVDEFSKNYDNVIFLGDFNTCIDDDAMTSFCSLNILTSLTDQRTCYKNPEKPTYIDLTLTNCPKYSQKTMSVKQAPPTFT